ncbi:MAG TPA: pyridoxamine 5'-phosphate oxidase family protein [Streptosporangiaceae bacterium]|nr:pyridoxamine 5'-phosphate oxidase family protein [Streptosporangiaceae bacterium]
MTQDASSGGTDVGRRIAERRDEAHMTVTDVAERAGMSPQYVSYLEASPAANPTSATVTRIAAALNVAPSTLEGAGLNMPPGQRSAARNATLHTLTEAECRALIAPGGVGRFLFVQAGRGPVAIPVNFKMDTAGVVFRISSHSVSIEGVHQQPVSFDVDHLDEALGEGWSVLLTGTAKVITGDAERSYAQTLDIVPWPDGEQDLYVRLSPTEITGRRIRISG